jgi:hypothetical protein
MNFHYLVIYSWKWISLEFFPPFISPFIFFILRNGRLRLHGLLFPGVSQQCACQEIVDLSMSYLFYCEYC